jgi:hypothetical protein
VRASLAIAAVVAASGAVAAAALLAGCGNRHRENREAPRDARRAPRVIEPSTDRVGPLPPYAIRADGVGPYRLGERMSDLLEQLPSGPQIVLFEIPGVVHRNVIRAEDDTILVGGEQSSTATFVAVVGAEVARTESGVHVGSTRDELVAALGPPIDDPERARDPRLIVPSGLPNLRTVLDGDRVVAIVVTGAATASRRVSDCPRPAAPDGAIGACLTPAGELIQVDGETVAIRSAEGERPIAAAPRAPGLVFAAALRNAAEARDELVVVTRTDEAAARSWSIVAYRLEGARLLRTVDPTQLYQLSSANARWIGADLHDVDLYLELTSRPDGIDVGGLLTTHSTARGKAIGAVVVITPTSVARRRKSALAEPADAGVPAVAGPLPAGHVTQDAAIDASDSAGGNSRPDGH